MAATQEKSSKIVSKQLRLKANEFLSSRRNANILVDLLNLFESGANQTPCLLTLELIFVELLKRGDMYQEIVPLKPMDEGPETQYRSWLRRTYEEAFGKVLQCIEAGKPCVQTQALATAMKIIAFEGKYPLEAAGEEYQFPTQKLRLVLMRLLSSERDNSAPLEKFQEFAAYADVLHYSWRALPPLTPRTHPSEPFIRNYLSLVDKLPLGGEPQPPQRQPEQEPVTLCWSEGNRGFREDPAALRRCLNKAWSCVMHWEHTPATHKQLLIVLLERALPHLDKPLALTDFLMDSLDAGGPVSLLALQGVFTMVQAHNLDYPDIFTKLYSMFEPEIFHTKFKARLFYLADLFLSSTHLPETLVAAFAKRLARLALVAPHEDAAVICMSVGNLLLRHPGLKRLVDRGADGGEREAASRDPYVMEERDPLKAQALGSSLWELRALQGHALPAVAQAARLVSEPLPSAEWDVGRLLEQTSQDVFDREIRRRGKEIALTFDRPLSLALPAQQSRPGAERLQHYWRLV